MNSTAPGPDPAPTGGAPRPGLPASPGAPASLPASAKGPNGRQDAGAPGEAPPHGAICTPVLPPRIRIPFPAIDFACGSARYRTQAMELVAEAIERVEARGSGDEGRGARRAEADREPLPASICHTPSSSHPSPPSPLVPGPSLYSLRQELGVWHLVFEGREALLRPERGLLYVAWLLQHPPAQPLHAVDLAACIPALYRAQLGLGPLAHPATGRAAPLPSHARLQERSLALDDAQSLRAVLRRERELEALLEDESPSEPEKAEALRELEALAQFQRQHGHRSRDAAARAVATVRKALQRLQAHLRQALDPQGAPHPVLRPFAEHLERYLLLPSARYVGRGGHYPRHGPAGGFTYEPPPGVKWSP
jgi:hypothetical protein